MTQITACATPKPECISSTQCNNGMFAETGIDGNGPGERGSILLQKVVRFLWIGQMLRIMKKLIYPR